ncbi:MAG: zf-HC2 domain-containing protein [Planctomycetota bacterium]
MEVNEMNCSEARERLHEWVDGELSETSSAESLREHLRSCPKCEELGESIRRMKHLVQIKYKRVPPPPALEGRVREAIATETLATGADPFSWVRSRTSLAAAAAILITVVLVWVMNPGRVVEDVHALVTDYSMSSHQQFVLHSDSWQIPCRTWSEAEQACIDRLDTLIQLPAFPKDRVTVQGVGILNIADRKAAKIFCQLDGKPFSLIAIPGQHIGLEMLCVCRRLDPYTVVCRQVGPTYFSMVADLNEESFVDGFLRDVFPKNSEKPEKR